jgi:hypothetical protein
VSLNFSSIFLLGAVMGRKEIMEWTKVCHCKLLLERVDDTTKKSCSGSSEVDIINIEKHVFHLTPFVEDEQCGVTLGDLETDRENKL